MTVFVPSDYDPFPGYHEGEYETIHRLRGVSGSFKDIVPGSQNGKNGFFVPDDVYARYQNDLRMYSGGVHQNCCPVDAYGSWECRGSRYGSKVGCGYKRVAHDADNPVPIKVRQLGNYCVEIDPTNWYSGPISYSMGGIYGPASGYGQPGKGRDGNGPIRHSGKFEWCFPGPGPHNGCWAIGLTPVSSACAGATSFWLCPQA